MTKRNTLSCFMPWQMNSTLIIIFFLSKCLVFPYFTHFFDFLQDLQFSGNCSKSDKIRQFETKCSSFCSQLVISLGGQLPGFLNLLTIEKRRGCKIIQSIVFSNIRFLSFAHMYQVYHFIYKFQGFVIFHS